MALFTSATTGDFDADATWDVGSGYPGSGDTFAIVAGHTVTIPSGLAANTTGNIDGSGTGTRGILIITDGGSLKLTGDLTVTNYNKLQLDGGSVLDINGNDLLTNTSDAEKNNFEWVGTALNRVIVKSSVVGTGDIRRTNGDAVAGIQNIQYVDFLDCGTVKVGNNFFANMNFAIKRCLFDGCGETTLGGWHTLASDFEIENIDFRNDRSLTANVAVIRHDETGSGSGTKSITSITATANTGTVLRWDSENLDKVNLVTDRITHTSVLKRGGDLVDSACRIVTTSGAGIESGGSDAAVRTLLFSDSDNPHTDPGTIDDLIDCVIDATYASGYTDDGDHFILNTTRDCTATGNLILDEKSGVFMNALGAAKSGAYVVNHNTCVGNYDAAYGALARTESGGSISGTLDLYSNLTYNRSVVVGALGMNFDTAGNDQITNMDNNAWYGIDDPYSGVTSATKTPGVTAGYGGNDITDDPQFFDDTRTFVTWAGQFTAAETADSGFEDLLLINGYDSINRTQDPTLITSNTVVDMVAWIRAGYAPTNTAYEGTAHDGGDIGAIAYQAAATGASAIKKLTGSKLTSYKLTSTKLKAV